MAEDQDGTDTLGRTMGACSTAASSWHSSSGSNVGGWEEKTPRGERPPDLTVGGAELAG